MGVLKQCQISHRNLFSVNRSLGFKVLLDCPNVFWDTESMWNMVGMGVQKKKSQQPLRQKLDTPVSEVGCYSERKRYIAFLAWCST